MPTTQQLRDAWSPVCQVTHRAFVKEAYEVLNNIFKKHNYAPRSGVTGSYNCRQITGGSNYSLHAYRFDSLFTFWTNVKVTMAVAVDVNSDTNPYGKNLVTDMPRAMVEEICAVRTNDGHQVWGWGGYYKNNKDAMHYELNCFPDQLATGIAPYPAQSGSQEEDMTQDEHNMLVDNYNRLKNLEAVADRDVTELESLARIEAALAAHGSGALSDADVNRIANVVADLIAKRLAS